MYKSLKDALLDLEKAGMLLRIREEVDPYLEMPAIAREAFAHNGLALFFEKVKGSKFPAAANIFGSQERLDFLFRDTIEATKTAVLFKSNPAQFFKQASVKKMWTAATAGWRALPKRSGSINDFEECSLADLPQLVCWPEDGGAFLTLPQVASRPSESASILETNLGMYRIQISGNDYATASNKANANANSADKGECGLHYQIKRDIAKHHQKAIEEDHPLKVSIFLGGSPAHTIASIMPMPENLSELVFAGMLSGRRFRYFMHEGYVVSSDADFVILGEVAPDLKPEGPFGDHIGYYSGKHLYPYLKVKKVLAKKDAIFPFTVVGRPPQEDTLFGSFIHQITKPMVPASLPGVHAVHAVDAAGVHPLCLALGSEQFIPYAKPENREPLELLKTANALLGFNQVSLCKYLLLAAKEDNPNLDVNDVPGFFKHILERANFARDLHFQTSTTIDTLDYTGTSLNHGSKLVITVAGPVRRQLRNSASDLNSLTLPQNFSNPRIAMDGVLTVQWDGAKPVTPTADDFTELKTALGQWEFHENYPWVSIINDTSTIDGTKQSLSDFLWMTFTRSDPAQDVHGLNEQFTQKHFAIDSPIIVDARIKTQHQKELDLPQDVKNRAQEILNRAGFSTNNAKEI